MVKDLEITILITSGCEREISVDTCLYYADFCDEVVLVDDQQPAMCEQHLLLLPLNVKYVHVPVRERTFIEQSYNKRLVAAKNARYKYVIHSNHDERYSRAGLEHCLAELKNEEKLTFCSGTGVKLKHKNLSLAYPGLLDYSNLGCLKVRICKHAQHYVPIAHYAVWKKENLVRVLEKTIEVHHAIWDPSLFDEYIFEFLAALEGPSKSLKVFYWIRNRLNDSVSPEYYTKLDVRTSRDVIQRKISLAFEDVHGVKVADVMSAADRKYPSSKFGRFVARLHGLCLRIFCYDRQMLVGVSGSELASLLEANQISFDKREVDTILRSFDRWIG